MERIEDGRLGIVVAGPTGFANNVYVVFDTETGDAAFIDAPDGVEESIAAAQLAGVTPKKILLTHSHPDHTASLDALKERYGCEVYADPAEPWLKEGQLDVPIAHGTLIDVGNLTFTAQSVPGHTPGSTAYLHGKHAFVGDTLFPGGPGHSRSNELLRQEIDSIVRCLYQADDDTTVWPGHGGKTTIGASKAEYAIFAAKQHAPDLHGDVLWLEH